MCPSFSQPLPLPIRATPGPGSLICYAKILTLTRKRLDRKWHLVSIRLLVDKREEES